MQEALDPEISQLLDTLRAKVLENSELKSQIKNLTTDAGESKKIFTQRLETLAGNLSTVNDWDEVLKASARFKEMDHQNLAYQAKLEKETQAAKEKYLDYENKLQALQKEMDLMKDEYERKISNIQARVQEEINGLQKAKEAIQTTTKFQKWITSLKGWWSVQNSAQVLEKGSL